MKRVTIIVMICTIFAKISGFVRVFLLSNFFGNGPIAEAFNYSNNIPNQWFSIIASSFVVGLIPMYLMVEQRESKAYADRFFNNVLNIVVLISAVFSGMFLIFPDAILSAITGYEGYTLALTIQFTRIVVSAVFTVSVVQLFTGFLNIRESFILPALISVPANIIVVITMVAARNGHPEVLAWGNWLSMIVQALIMIMYARLKGYRYQFILDFKDPHLKRMILKGLPVIVTSISSQIGSIIIGVYTTRENGVTLMTNATLITGFVQAAFATTITSIYFPKLAKAITQKRFDTSEAIVNKSMILIALFILPSTVGLFLLSKPIALMFFSNKLALEQTQLLSLIIKCQAIALLANCVIDVLTRLYYAYQDMKVPMYFSLANIFFTVLFGIGLYMNQWGLVGLALGSSIASWCVFLVFFIYAHFSLHLKNQKIVLISFIKIFISSIMMGVVVWLALVIFDPYLKTTHLTFIAVVLGVMTYTIVITLMNIKEVNVLLDWLRTRIKGLYPKQL